MEILSLIFVAGIQYVSFTTATRLQVEGLAGEKNFLLFQNVQNISGALPAFCSVGNGGYFMG
jgi:hypothetical protein